MALDVGFPLALGLVAAREVIAARNRNFLIVLVVFLFAAANALDHVEALGIVVFPGLGWRLGFALVLMLISLIGGRIIPSFTRNWLMKHGEKERLPGQPDSFDKLVLAVSAIALAVWAARPEAGAAGAGLLLAGLLQGGRLSRWRGLAAVRDPLVFVLHLGSFLLARGLLLLVCAPELPMDYLTALHLGGALWAGAFLVFVLAYGPKLLRSRVKDAALNSARRGPASRAVKRSAGYCLAGAFGSVAPRRSPRHSTSPNLPGDHSPR